MKYSYNWIQKHIGGANKPNEKDIEAILTKCAFEVEEVVEAGDDYVLDIKVLPDRSHDALSHLGMAREIVSLYNKPEENTLVQQDHYAQIKKEQTLPAPEIIVQDPKACPRFMAVTIKNIQVGPTETEIKKLLEGIGQKSINTVVDATNYVLYDLGKPMHAFDADKVVGPITVRFAKKGEKVTTLDGKHISLDESILVLADDEGPLDIAGIKGGTKAEVNSMTKNIIITSANFDGTLIRKTSQKVNIKTDAAKRFENGITSEFCEPGLLATANMILELASTADTQVSHITDLYPKPEVKYKVGVSTAEINKVLGTTLTDEKVKSLLNQRGLECVEKEVISEVIQLAKDTIAKPYKRGASVLYDAPDCFDCSSLTAYLYKEVGIAIPRIAVDQYVFSYDRIGEPKQGDLLFINTGIQKTNTGSYYSQVLGKDIAESAIRYESVEWMPGTKVEGGVDHVGIYMGDGYVLHATSNLGNVVLEKIEESTVFKNGYRCKFVIPQTENRFVVSVPFERLDIRIKEDLIDEIGKLVGTEGASPTTNYQNAVPGKLDKAVYYTTLVRELLLQEGFSEVMNSSFSDEGDIAILNSVDPKKNHLRKRLTSGMNSALTKGLYYLPFLGKEEVIKIFEIGSIFTDKGEKVNVVIGVSTKNKKQRSSIQSYVESIAVTIHNTLSMPWNATASKEGGDRDAQEMLGSEIIEFTIEIDKLPELNENSIFPNKNYTLNSKYQPLSNYPFITRDVAFFTPEATDMQEVEKMIREKAGDLCVKFYRFDEFQKDGRVSYGYRIIFQSFDRTLTDAEVEPNINSVYDSLRAFGFETR